MTAQAHDIDVFRVDKVDCRTGFSGRTFGGHVVKTDRTLRIVASDNDTVASWIFGRNGPLTATTAADNEKVVRAGFIFFEPDAVAGAMEHIILIDFAALTDCIVVAAAEITAVDQHGRHIVAAES